VIDSQESPKMEEFFRDFDWELDFRIGTEIVFDLK
jgi:hypothetical protein